MVFGGDKVEVGCSSQNQKILRPEDVLEIIKHEDVKLVDCCFTDPLGQWHHCTFAANQLDLRSFNEGLPFDGSSITLFSEICESDIMMVPDPNTAWIDPFHQYRTLHLTCSVRNPACANNVSKEFTRDPRGIAKRAENYVRDCGIADTIFVGPEAEFFIFDHVHFDSKPNGSCFEVDSEEAFWNSGKKTNSAPNLGHRVEAKHSYFPVSPLDHHNDIRSEMLMVMEQIGLPVEKQHHEVATSQGELGVRALPLLSAADGLQAYKYIVKNVAKARGKTATFMPKPVVADNGSGLHVHMSLWKNGQNLFYDAAGKYVNLSEMCLHFIGGILNHTPAICAFTNPTTNSYKRLVPGFEAPVNLVYSKGNRSAAIRIPMYQPNSVNAKRLEFRCPDPAANPYLAFTVILMAGIDGIRNKIAPGEPCDCDVYEMKEEARMKIPTTPRSLREALQALEKNHSFLLQGGVFSEEFIRSYIEFKRDELQRVEMTPHPLEFSLYYSC